MCQNMHTTINVARCVCRMSDSVIAQVICTAFAQIQVEFNGKVQFSMKDSLPNPTNRLNSLDSIVKLPLSMGFAVKLVDYAKHIASGTLKIMQHSQTTALSCLSISETSPTHTWTCSSRSGGSSASSIVYTHQQYVRTHTTTPSNEKKVSRKKEHRHRAVVETAKWGKAKKNDKLKIKYICRAIDEWNNHIFFLLVCAAIRVQLLRRANGTTTPETNRTRFCVYFLFVFHLNIGLFRFHFVYLSRIRSVVSRVSIQLIRVRMFCDQRRTKIQQNQSI